MGRRFEHKYHLRVFRTDKLGDLLLSLPALFALRRALPRSTIEFVFDSAYRELLTPLLTEWDISPVEFPSFPLSRRGECDGSLILYLDKREYPTLPRIGSGHVLGVYRHLSSLLYFHQVVFQRRSKGVVSEAQYNLQMASLFVRKITASSSFSDPPPVILPVHATARSAVQKKLLSLGISGFDAFILLHPGMGGSGMTPSFLTYVKMIRSLKANTSKKIVITEGPSQFDKELVSQIEKECSELISVVRGLSLVELSEMLRLSDLVIAPSTGPLHLAHFVGATTFGIFSPLRSQLQSRWAPSGGSGKVMSWSPSVKCPAKRYCLKTDCPYYLCLDTLTPSPSLSAASTLARKSE